ncbi:PAS domain-containing protein [Duganella sp. LX20W]|uniref:Sensory/regulatory protein RpfC n=1 Tax=Rugamonas brunnea TaxID=2758569 RepID=A0A7W2ESC4_9BURK|nr:PAS domain-containing protein [Rugamonas brunnea]MBA5637741.1 PAS domain-containing protein [Rugamonas brunnea]
MPEQPSPSLPSIRSQIALLVLACALPTVIGFAALVNQLYGREHAALREDTLEVARTVAAAIDRDLAQSASAAQALATSPSLQSGDLASFRTQAARLLAPQFPGSRFLLSDGNGVLLPAPDETVAGAFGARRNEARLRPLLTVTDAPDTGAPPQPAVSVVYDHEQALLAVDVPVRYNGKTRYALTVLLKPDRLARSLVGEHVTSRHSVALYNRDGVLVAHYGAGGNVVGQQAPPELRVPLGLAHETLLDTRLADGTPVYLGLNRAPASGLAVAVAAPQALADERLLQTVGTVSVVLALLLAIGFTLAWIVGGRISRSVRALLAPAQALASGAPFTLERMSFSEAQAVGQAMRSLETDLQRHRTELAALVTERTAQLEQERAQLESLYATAPVGLSYVDPQLRVLRINDYLAAYNARPVAAHLGQPIASMITDPGVRRSVLHDYGTVLQTGKPLVGIERSGISAAAPGRTSHWIVSYYPQFDAGGALAGITSVLLDISELKRAEAALHQSRQLFQSVVEHMPATIFVKRASDLRYEMFNRYGETLLGLQRADVLGKTDYDILPPAQAEAFGADDRRVLASGQVSEVEQELLTADGGPPHFLTTRKVALRDEHGQVTHLLGIALDITERRQAEAVLHSTAERLAQSEQFLRAVTDNLPGMVAYWDANLQCRFANRYFLEWHSREAGQIIGARMTEVLDSDRYARCAPHVAGALAGMAQGFESRLAWPSGAISYTWVNFIPDHDEHDQVRGFFVLESDVTELKETELHLQQLNEELRLARDKAEAASRAKSEFVANMSHEIRTPMNAIIGLARLLQDAPLAQRERSYLDKIQLATQSLLSLVNDVLDISRIESGQLVLEAVRFQFEHVLNSVSVMAAASAWDKGVELVYDIDARVPRELVGDAMRLQQLLLNLVSNAIKFTPHGEVQLSVALLASTDDAVTLELLVRDTGIGITAEQQRHIFDAFSQGDSSTSRKYGGAGLGLAICRRIVQLKGGTLTVDSAPGQGAAFRAVCSLRRAEPRDDGCLPDSEALRGLRLLVADDNASVRAALRHACDAFGWDVSCVDSSAAALTLLASPVHTTPAPPGAPAKPVDLLTPGTPYDLLLLDYDSLGAGDGGLLVQARAAGVALPPVLLMAPEHQSANLAHECAELGAAGVLAKAATPARLLAAVRAARQPAAPAPALPSHALRDRLTGMRLLLVEDNPINQEVAQYLLTHAGAQVTLAGNGEQALELLQQAPERYDAVLMDIQMPVMNGYDASAAARRLGLRLPIIAMTANVMEEDLRRAADAGMDAHVAKPIDIEQLLGTLTRLAPGAIRHGDGAAHGHAPASGAGAGTGAAGAGAAGATGAAATAMDAPPALPALPGIDLDAALPRMGGDFDALVQLLRRFVQSQGGSVAEVRQLLASGQRQLAGQALHRLRGVAANLGASDVAQCTAQVEAALLEGHPEQVEPLLTALQAALSKVADGAALLPASAATATGPREIDDSSASTFIATLVQLQDLLQNNNLKALSLFQSLRPRLEAVDGTATTALAEAVETLQFRTAGQLVHTMLQQKEIA